MIVTVSAGVSYLFPDLSLFFAPGAPTDFGSLASFWLLVGAFYLWLPRHRIRRRKLRPLTREVSHVAGQLEQLRIEAIPDRRVAFYIDFLDTRISAVAFGRVGARSVVLSRALVDLAEIDRDRFRAIVMHELAHIAARDIDISVVSVVTVRVYAIGVVVPRLLTFAVESTDYIGLSMALHPLAVSLFVPLARNAVLHSRELHADALATRWTGTQVWNQLFSSPRASVGRRLGWTWLSTHPSLRLRRRALEDPGVLLELQRGDVFAMGFALSLTIAILAWVMVPFSIPQVVFLTPPCLVFAIALYLGIWRQTTLVGAHRTTSLRSMALGSWLALGLGLGLILSPWYAVLIFILRSSFIVISVFVVWWVLATTCCILLVHWMAVVARTWVPAADKYPRMVVLGTTGLAAVLSSQWLSQIYAMALVGPTERTPPRICELLDPTSLPAICAYDPSGHDVYFLTPAMVFVEDFVFENLFGAMAAPFLEVHLGLMVAAAAIPLLGMLVTQNLRDVRSGLHRTVLIGIVAALIILGFGIMTPSVAVIPMSHLVAAIAAYVAAVTAGELAILHGMVVGLICATGPFTLVSCYALAESRGALGTAAELSLVQTIHISFIGALIGVVCAIIAAAILRARSNGADQWSH